MQILIVGMGYLGQKLGQLLTPENHTVLGLRRTIPPEAALATEGKQMRWVAADVTDPDSLTCLPREVEQIVYAVSPDERTPEAYASAYPLGVQNIKKALPHARMLFVSSTAVYNQDEGMSVFDTTPAEATTFAAVQLRKAEALVLSGPESGVVVRASGIYGPSRTRLITRLMHEDLPEETRNIWTNRIHRDDLARVLLFLLKRTKESGTFLASDNHPSQLGTMQDWINEHAARPKLTPTLPLTGSKPTLGPSKGTSRRQNRRILPSRLEELGFRLHYPSFREGYRPMLREIMTT